MFSKPTKSDGLVAAFVQYVNGDVTNPNGEIGANKISFKTLLLFGESIELSEKSYLKIVTNNKCVLVFYGPGLLQLPTNALDSWDLTQMSTRAICKESKLQVKLGKNQTELNNGEIFFHENKFASINTDLVFTSKSTKKDLIYQLNKVTPNKSLQNSAGKAWYNSLPLPEEQLSSKIAKSPILVKSRWYFEVLNGGSSLNHNNSIFNQDDLESFGMRITRNFKWRDHSALVEFMVLESEADQGGHYCCGPLPPDAKFNYLDAIQLGVGKRFNHERNWSFDSIAGLSFDTHQISQGLEGGSDIHVEVKYYSLYIKGGISRIFWSGKKFALNISANLQAKFSIFKDSEKQYNNLYTPIEYDGGFSQIALFFTIGPVYQQD